MAEGERQWHYLDVSSANKGPFSEHALLKMVVRRLPGLGHETLCWTPGMPEWLPLGTVEPFKSTIMARDAAWHYLDSEGKQVGPVDVVALEKLFSDGDLDGLTIVWHAGMEGWKAIAECNELRSMLVREDHEDDEEGGSGEQQPQGYDEAMVFQGLDPTPTLARGGKGGGKGEGGNGEGAKAKRSFVGDDGTRYRWNEATSGWEEAGSGYESEGEEEDEGEENGEDEDERSNHDKKDKGQQPAAGAEGQQASTEGVKPKRKRNKKKKKKDQWDPKARNLWVYVTGLPPDTTFEELHDHFKKVGLLAVDPETQQARIKIYKDSEGNMKGDASICFARSESVELAIEILNQGFLRPGVQLTVQQATFEKKGDEFVAKKRKVAEAQRKVAKAAAKQALSWADEGDTGLNKAQTLKIVVLKNMFDLKDTESPGFIDGLREDIEEECGKIGEMAKLTIFEKHPEGVAVVKYKTGYAAEQCIKVMNGRYFAGRKISCTYWDGATDYTKVVTVASIEHGEEEEEEKRLDEFGDWLENQELPDELKLDVEG